MAIGIPLGMGATYLSWKYPGLLHKLYQDAIAEKVIIAAAKRAPFGGTVLASEVKDMMRDRWIRKTAAGTIIGTSARTLGYGLTGYAIYDTAKLAKFAGGIYGQHLENITNVEESDAKAFSKTHMVRMRN